MLTNTWRKSSRSNSLECVEVKRTNGEVQIRDSKLGDTSPVLTVSELDWTDFIALIKRNNAVLAVPGLFASRAITPGEILMTTTVADEDADHLIFTASEWTAFIAGAQAGEFDL